MRWESLVDIRKLSFAVCGVILAIAAGSASAQPDPPEQAGRLAALSGTVSIQTAGWDGWGQAIPNLPLGPGDRIYTDSDGRAEIQVGQSFVRVGPNSDVTLVDWTPNGVFIGVAQGSVHIRSLGFWPGQSLEVNTPNGSVTMAQPGEVRLDVYPGSDAAVFTSYDGEETVTGAGGFVQPISYGQSLELSGTYPVYPQWLQPAGYDDLDYWSRSRDQAIMHATAYRYMSPEIPGGEELDTAGTWMPASDYGAIWFPNSVPYGWSPYRYGHWVNHDPWGSVWVEDEPWGYAPFHYGRWVNYEGRWGWVPGPVQTHPVWSPALVVFAGGNFGGGGLSIWFPLGPGEPYKPWYPCSPRYIDQVNISNIRPARRVVVQNTYVNVNIVNATYVNRTIGVTAMRQEDFAAGRPVRQAAVAVSQAQMQQVHVVERPVVQAKPAPLVTPAPVRPVPVMAARPVLINAQGQAVAAQPGAKPAAPPVRPATMQAKPLPGRVVVAPPANATPFHSPAGTQPQNAQPRQAATPYQAPTQQPANRGTANPQPQNQPATPAYRQPTPPQPQNVPATPAHREPANNAQPGNEPAQEYRPPANPAPQNVPPAPAYRPPANPQQPTQPAYREPNPPANASPSQNGGRPQGQAPPQQETQPHAASSPNNNPGARPPANNAKPAQPGDKDNQDKGKEKDKEKNKDKNKDQ